MTSEHRAKKRVFIIAAQDDEYASRLLVSQLQGVAEPVEIVDPFASTSLDESWKAHVRKSLISADFAVVLVSTNLMKSRAARWEIWCASDAERPIVGIQLDKASAVPSELNEMPIVPWTVDAIATAIDNFSR